MEYKWNWISKVGEGLGLCQLFQASPAPLYNQQELFVFRFMQLRHVEYQGSHETGNIEHKIKII